MPSGHIAFISSKILVSKTLGLGHCHLGLWTEWMRLLLIGQNTGIKLNHLHHPIWEPDMFITTCSVLKWGGYIS